MTNTPNILHNRKTKTSYLVNSPRSLTLLDKQSLFATAIDFAQVEEFIQEVVASLPIETKEKVALQLRHELGRTNKNEILSIINHPQAFAEVINDCKQQAISIGFDPNALSPLGFLKLLSTSLINAKLNTLFPGLAILTQVAAVAAQPSFYAYHAGQPIGGEDLCAKAKYDCIQGFLTKLGQEWTEYLPQVARRVEREVKDINDCITQEGLQNMMDRAYRGPNEYAGACTFDVTTNGDGKLKINVTQVDPITCDIMKDSAIGFTQNCPTQPPAPTPANFTNLYVVLGIAGCTGALALLAFGLYKYREHRRHEVALRAKDPTGCTTYQSINNNP